MAALENARPATRSSPLLTVMWRRPEACSCVGASDGASTKRTSTSSKRCLPPRRRNSASSSQAAFSRWRRPLSTKLIRLRQPPSRLMQTFNLAGAGSPLIPLIRTRSGPSWVSWMVSKRATTSGFGYSGAPIS